MKHWYKKIPARHRLLVAILGASLVVVALAWMRFWHDASTTDATARAIVAECSKQQGDHSACYEEEVPLLYPKFSVPDIFTVIRQIRSLDTSYQFCHVLGHKLGERVVAEDPDKWVDAIALNPPDNLCSNGFIHGVTGGRFRADVLNDATIARFLPQFKAACAPRPTWQPSDLDRAICYHGMGHLFDFITNANLNKALDLCAQITPDSFHRVCIQGVFMQIYQPLEPDDFALIAQMKVKPTKDTVRQFCATFKNPEYVGSCLEESWPLFQKGIFDGTGVGAFCSGQPNAAEADVCYQAVSSIIGRTSLGNPDRAVAACNQVPVARQQTCFTYSAQAVLEENLAEAGKAIQLCERASAAVAHGCLATLVDHARFTFGNNTQAYTAFCASVPEDLQPQCVPSH